jgi:hypothetical protein
MAGKQRDRETDREMTEKTWDPTVHVHYKGTPSRT